MENQRDDRWLSGWKCRNSQVDITGTNVLERMYEVTIEKPTASDSGTNNAWAAPCMKNEGMKTASTHSIASRRGTAVWALPARTARAMLGVCSNWVWMFSTSTVASSTRMPVSHANSPSAS